MQEGDALAVAGFDPSIDPVDGAEDGRVCCIMIVDLFRLARTRGVEFDRLLVGTRSDEKTVCDPNQEISWESFVQIWRNAAKIWSAEQLVGIGRTLVRMPAAQTLVDLARVLDDPTEVFRLLVGSGRHPQISCMDQEMVALEPQRIRIELRTVEGFDQCEQYCRVQAGLFEAIPVVMGYGAAEVDFVMTDRSAIYEIWIPDRSEPVAKIRNWLRRISRVFLTSDRLMDMIARLNRRYDMANQRITMLGDQISKNKIIEERFTQCFELAPVAMLISRNSDMSVVYINDKMVEVTGYPREEIMAWTPEDMSMWATPSDRQPIHDIATNAGGAIDGFEIRALHSDGREIVALLSCKPVELDWVSCTLWHAIDITDRKNNERDLKRVRDNLEELVDERTRELRRSLDALQQVQRLASIGTLAAGVAHEINNPVASIRAAAEFALMCGDDVDASANYREALKTCVEQSDRCSVIVRNVLRFSRGEVGVRSREDLRDLIVRACRLVQEYATANVAEVHIELGEVEIPVFVNSIEMEQVFVNVLRNAIESGDGRTHIEVVAQRLSSGGFVEINDDGSGIGDEHVPFMFDPFYTTRQGQGGTGLGLSVAHGIVHAHGGAISATTLGHQGTAIQIQLPLCADEPG